MTRNSLPPSSPPNLLNLLKKARMQNQTLSATPSSEPEKLPPRTAKVDALHRVSSKRGSGATDPNPNAAKKKRTAPMTSAALKVSVKQSGNTRANTRANTSKATVLPQGLSIDLDVDEQDQSEDDAKNASAGEDSSAAEEEDPYEEINESQLLREVINLVSHISAAKHYPQRAQIAGQTPSRARAPKVLEHSDGFSVIAPQPRHLSTTSNAPEADNFHSETDASEAPISAIVSDDDQNDIQDDASDSEERCVPRSSTRDAKYNSERPVIQLQVPEPTKRGKKKVSKATGHVVTPEAPGLITDPLNQGWSAATHMTFPEPGLRYISLTKQPQTLRRVINDTIDIAVGIALFQDAFPKTEAQRHYIQLAMSGACDKLGQSVILDRFTRDTRYRDFIISCVTSRISHLRSEVKKEAAKVVPGLYDLLKLKPDARSELVKDLLKACCYIFPLGDPLKTSTWRRHQPYLHPAVLAVLKASFWNAQGLGRRLEGTFHSSSEADNAKEIPLAMLGLVGTAIFASLKEYSSGEHQKEGFEAAVFQEEYNKHIVFCQERIIKPDQSGRQKYHNLTAKLYREASNTTSFDDSNLPDVDFDGME
ncbi:hypothetical protein VKT23_017744 [Stygiomarasmius scandens]|uniref:DUF6532 domain-containing protein n=1 Tax=Marasmiellus scandens TaxID=2682957 RepID=A0ABR1IRC3_9AGAR